jgi:enoyl-CoA hydratase/carnithine racemase
VRKSAAARPLRCGVSTSVVDGVAWLRLERPQAHNRITCEMAQALCDAAAEIELNDDVAAVVVAASGPSFCAGVERGGDWEQRLDWVNAVAQLTRPVLAAIQGDAVAEGLELALACDLRVVSDRARLAMPQLAAGRLPTHGGTQRLPRVVGRMRALDLLFTGRTIEAAEAEEMGLASRVFRHDDFGNGLNGVIGELKTKGRIALRYAKEAVLKGCDLTFDQGVRLEEDLYVLLQTTRDRQEGIRAFQQKRKPVYHGR